MKRLRLWREQRGQFLYQESGEWLSREGDVRICAQIIQSSAWTFEVILTNESDLNKKGKSMVAQTSVVQVSFHAINSIVNCSVDPRVVVVC